MRLCIDDVLGSELKNWIIFSIYNKHLADDGTMDKVFRIILKSVSVENGNCIDNDVEVLGDPRSLTRQVLQDAGLDRFGGDIGIEAPVAIARWNRTERSMHKLRNFLQQRRIVGHQTQMKLRNTTPERWILGE